MGKLFKKISGSWTEESITKVYEKLSGNWSEVISGVTTQLIGDFENTYDGWNMYKSGGNDFKITNYWYTNGAYALQLFHHPNTGGGLSSATKSFDLTSFNSLVFDFRNQNDYASSNFIVTVDGFTEVDYTQVNTNEILDYTVNISGYTGICSIEFKLSNSPSYPCDVIIDNIRLVS